MASGAYAFGMSEFLAGNIDWDANTIKVMAVKTGYTQDKEAHQFLSNVSSSRYVGTTDQTLGSKTNVIDSTNNRVEISGGSVTYTAVALDGSNNVIGFIIYKDTGTPGTSALLAFDDTADIIPNGGNITYTPNVEGIIQYSYGA